MSKPKMMLKAIGISTIRIGKIPEKANQTMYLQDFGEGYQVITLAIGECLFAAKIDDLMTAISDFWLGDDDEPRRWFEKKDNSPKQKLPRGRPPLDLQCEKFPDRTFTMPEAASLAGVSLYAMQSAVQRGSATGRQGLRFTKAQNRGAE